MIVDLSRNDMNRISEVGSGTWASLPSGTVFNRLANDVDHQRVSCDRMWT